jgi:hypothetical protein
MGSDSTPIPATPALADALSVASEAIAYHEKRMGKRLRRLKGEDAFPDEPSTGVLNRCDVMPDPFPPPPPRRA